MAIVGESDGGCSNIFVEFPPISLEAFVDVLFHGAMATFTKSENRKNIGQHRIGTSNKHSFASLTALYH